MNDKQTEPAAETKDTELTVADNKSVEAAPVEDSTMNQQNQTNPVVQAAPAPRSGVGLALFAVLLALASLAGAGFTWYQTQVANVQGESSLVIGVTEIGGQVSRIGDAVSRLEQRQSEVVSQAEMSNQALELKSLIQDQFRDLDARQTQLSSSLTTVSEELQKGVGDYVVDEVRQLLRLANTSLIFGDNVESAVKALSLADQQLKGMNDPRFSMIRSKINDELALLDAVELPDVEALGARLRAAAGQVPELALANEPEQRAIETVDAAPAEATGWRAELKQIWQDILGSVRIQRVDQPPKPLLVPEQRYFLDQNIQLTLSKAELALMQGHAGIYQSSIGDAQGWLRDYFDLTDPRTGALLQQLDELAGVEISVTMPDVTGSYQALQALGGGQ